MMRMTNLMEVRMRMIILMEVRMMRIILMKVTSLPSLPTTASKEQIARPPKISET